MKLSLAAALLVCLACTLCAHAQDDAGWISLFDGKTLDQWEQKGGAALYKIEDGAIVGTCVPNTDNSFLCTKKTFGDFVFECEFKGHPALNSGIQIRGLSLPGYKNGRVHGYQCELEDEGQDRDWSGGIYDEARRGWLFPTKEDKEWGKKFGDQGKKVWKNGEWNQVRVECKGDSIKTWINGELRADLKDNMTPAGFLALQVHSVGKKTEAMSVSWRNLRIKELK